MSDTPVPFSNTLKAILKRHMSAWDTWMLKVVTGHWTPGGDGDVAKTISCSRCNFISQQWFIPKKFSYKFNQFICVGRLLCTLLVTLKKFKKLNSEQHSRSAGDAAQATTCLLFLTRRGKKDDETLNKHFQLPACKLDIFLRCVLSVRSHEKKQRSLRCVLT